MYFKINICKMVKVLKLNIDISFKHLIIVTKLLCNKCFESVK